MRAARLCAVWGNPAAKSSRFPEPRSPTGAGSGGGKNGTWGRDRRGWKAVRDRPRRDGEHAASEL